MKLAIAILSLRVLAAATEAVKIDVWKAGEEGYKVFRIPGIVVTAKGTLLAYAEARKSDRGDWNAIDIVLRRSTDRGRTWSPSRKIAEVEGPKHKNPVAIAQNLADNSDVTYNNPVAIPDRSGSVHFVFCLEYMRAFYMRSNDDGVTWSKPIEITSTFDRFRSDYDWKVLATGPGHGIQLINGRLLIPVWLSTGTGGHAHRPSVTSIIYSDDRGRTWNRGAIAIPNTSEFINPNETAAVQLADGRVMLNARNESKQNRRLVTISKDGATGWSKPKVVDALPEPICMAGFARSGKLLLFSNPRNLDRRDGKAAPGVPRDRRNLTLHVSHDEGQSWPVRKIIEPSWSGYSDIAIMRDGSVLLLYERGAAAEDRFRVEALTLALLPPKSLAADKGATE
ncbi:MAG TPA: sialidase family protein [Bryobacteraceae bacterium]|nr:sialidase family protein [Bryobacteraceae bacterium]